jgi:PAS domain S-box-containing protein
MMEPDGQPAVLRSSPGPTTGIGDEEGYRELFQASRDAVVITGPGGDIREVNQACLDMFGLDKENILGLNFKDLYTNPLDAKRFSQDIAKKGWLRDYEVRLKGPGGSHFHALFTVSIRFDAKASPPATRA